MKPYSSTNFIRYNTSQSLFYIAIVIYEDKLTDALFDVLAYLCTVIFETTPTVLIAMEKRYAAETISLIYLYFL